MARKPSSRCLPASVKVKMDGRPPPDDANSSPIEFLQENFETFTIGARKKELKSDIKKEDEMYSGEDSDSQDVNILEKWSSMDRITVDGSESSEWGRSISSSMSWFDESEYEATLKVKSILDNIDCMLYGEAHTPLSKPLAEECQQWRQRFPHLRVVGCRVGESVTQETENDLKNSECNSVATEEESAASSREEFEGEEVVYACHGKIEPQQSLSHEFVSQHESLKDPECERIKEALLNELATHVWKEVFVPSIKRTLEQQNCSDVSSSPRGEGEPYGTCFVENQSPNRNVDVKTDSSTDKQLQSGISLSAREERTLTQSTNELSDPLDFYRRYSDQLSYCDVKCGSEFMSLEIEAEKDYDKEELKEIKNRRTSRSSGKDFYLKRPKDVKVEEKASSRTEPQNRRLWSSSRRLKQIEVVEDLRPLEKATAWTNSVSEGLDCSGRYMLRKDTKHFILPAIENQRFAPNYEPSSYCVGRSSSALPKLPHQSFRPTMSSYQNKVLLQAGGRKVQNMKYQEVSLSESRIDSNEKVTKNTGCYSGIPSSKSTKDKKRKERKLSNPHYMNFSHS
ncbi:hypothetical protein J437_LFUL007868 [Ladona fulva]|uniref:DUF3719 domain-containing protein n=1 Tax=Ladona fulva TaxID=123851 RepID=A0A8K0JWC1_LADFU|nr:hypothetical protein J437_LFUL007868 [Ladona fulva]